MAANQPHRTKLLTGIIELYNSSITHNILALQLPTNESVLSEGFANLRQGHGILELLESSRSILERKSLAYSLVAEFQYERSDIMGVLRAQQPTDTPVLYHQVICWVGLNFLSPIFTFCSNRQPPIIFTPKLLEFALIIKIFKDAKCQ